MSFGVECGKRLAASQVEGRGRDQYRFRDGSRERLLVFHHLLHFSQSRGILDFNSHHVCIGAALASSTCTTLLDSNSGYEPIFIGHLSVFILRPER
jgi:hypothetical protein